MIPQDLLLVKILKVVTDLLPDIKLPKRVGRPLVYSPKVITCCFLVMVAKRLSKRGLHTFLTNESDPVAAAVRSTIPFPDEDIPVRRTFDRRLANCHLHVQLYLLEGATYLARRNLVGLSRLALDNRMFQALGAVWHRKDQILGIIPKGLRNIDTLAGWGYSHYRKWIYGHALDVFCTTGKLVIPVLAIARSLNLRGNTAAKRHAYLLPKVKRGVVSADAEYEDQQLDNCLKVNGRSLHAAKRRNPKDTPKSVTYRKRKTTVEPLYERFLLALSARGKLPFKGKQGHGWMMTALFLYQVAVISNVMSKNPNPLQVTHLIHAL